MTATTCIDSAGHVPLVSDEAGPVYCRKCQAPLKRATRPEYDDRPERSGKEASGA